MITLLLYIAGLMIGASIFLYLYSVFHSARKRIKRPSAAEPQSKGSMKAAEPVTLGFRHIKLPPGERICPVCRSKLGGPEALYATETVENGRKKIMIDGCRRCTRRSKDKSPPSGK
jgi:hypothetical protein